MAQQFQHIRSLALLIISLLLISSCATPPRIYFNEDPAAVFSSYTNYSFQANLGTDRPEYTSLLSQYLKIAVQRELNTRGYQEVKENPDILVNFFLQTEEKIRSTATPSFGGYYGYRPYGTWGGYAGYETRITHYTEGTLTVDLVDASRDQLVWEGTLIDRIPGDEAENLRPRVEEAVVNIFSKFPYTAGN